MGSQTPSAAGLYVHVPFCSAVCPYCDFAVTTGGAPSYRRFVDALEREIARYADDGWRFDTVYFGGGTPSALAADDLAHLFATLRRSFDLAPNARWHFEANPEDVNSQSLAAWRDLGVDFLSLGVQTFDNEYLTFLGRRHSRQDARRALALALGSGFDTVSADLIFGLPEQTPERFARDLDEIVALAPSHVSCYQLTIHEGTPFAHRQQRGELEEMPEPAQGELFLLTHRRLAEAGLEAYEVSNFARGEASRSAHNQKYWNHTPYLGLGPSAHSFDGRRRWWNQRRLGPWRARLDRGESPVAEHEDLEPRDLALEALMLGLRTVDGMSYEAFRQRYGFDFEQPNTARIAAWQDRGLVQRRPDAFCATLEGLAVADSLVRELDLTALEG